MTLEEQLSTLMMQTQQGSQTSYDLLLRAIEKIARGTIRQRIKQSETAEDVIQEILISVDRAKHTYDTYRPFLPWLYALIEYRMADHWRKTIKLTEREVFDEDALSSFIDAKTETHSDSDINEKILIAVQNLPEKQKQSFLLAKRDGLSIKETAEQLAISESAVKVNIHRAISKLRKILLGEDPS